MNKNVYIVLILIMIAAVCGYWLYSYTGGYGVQGCTQEAMICPDGSSVGRTGLNCEFAECPSTEVIFGQDAEALCGPQPPASCMRGKALGCASENKKWDCYLLREGSETTVIDTSDWKTYRSEEYGFEVKYPLEWEASPNGTAIAIYNPANSHPESELIHPDINIGILTNSSKLPLHEFVTKLNGGWYANYDLDERIIDARPGILADTAGRVPRVPAVAVFVDIGNQVVVISDHGSSRKEFLKILESFKFLNN